MSKSMGIDSGTSNSAAVAMEAGRAKIIPCLLEEEHWIRDKKRKRNLVEG